MSQDIQPFVNPKVDLEQYPTGAEIASRLLFTVRAPQALISSIAAVETIERSGMQSCNFDISWCRSCGRWTVCIMNLTEKQSLTWAVGRWVLFSLSLMLLPVLVVSHTWTSVREDLGVGNSLAMRAGDVEHWSCVTGQRTLSCIGHRSRCTRHCTGECGPL